MRLKTVFDTNVYIAATLKPGGYMDLWLDKSALSFSKLEVYTSDEILEEVAAKLTLFNISDKSIELFVERIRLLATVKVPIEKITAVKDDPDDNMILECAVAADAHIIISADRHLLKLNPYRGIGIAHPRELKHIFASDAV